MNKAHDISVLIGRFQPVHTSHIKIIKRALEISDNLIIVIGSDNQPRTPKNPFTSTEREEMIINSIPDALQQRIEFARIQDSIYNMQEWASYVQNAVGKISAHTNITKKTNDIVLIGHHKDESSFYLDMFPQWKSIEIPLIDDLHSTDIRQDFFATGYVNPDLPGGVEAFMTEFKRSIMYDTLCEEYDYIWKYKKQWEVSPYPPTFVTTDAIVIQSGHVLLVKRRASPGKGLYALPGGFLDQHETLEDGMIRELREETKIKVPEPVLRGCITKSRVFDAPYRSLRGRTITNAFLIELGRGELPKVKGSDDAEKAVWIPLNEFYKMQKTMFEDHFSIIMNMIGGI